MELPLFLANILMALCSGNANIILLNNLVDLLGILHLSFMSEVEVPLEDFIVLYK